MKKLLIGLLTLGSLSAFGGSKLACAPDHKDLYYSSLGQLKEALSDCTYADGDGVQGGVVYGGCRLKGFQRGPRTLLDVTWVLTFEKGDRQVFEGVYKNKDVKTVMNAFLLSIREGNCH